MKRMVWISIFLVLVLLASGCIRGDRKSVSNPATTRYRT